MPPLVTAKVGELPAADSSRGEARLGAALLDELRVAPHAIIEVRGERAVLVRIMPGVGEENRTIELDALSLVNARTSPGELVSLADAATAPARRLVLAPVLTGGKQLTWAPGFGRVVGQKLRGRLLAVGDHLHIPGVTVNLEHLPFRVIATVPDGSVEAQDGTELVLQGGVAPDRPTDPSMTLTGRPKPGATEAPAAEEATAPVRRLLYQALRGPGGGAAAAWKRADERLAGATVNSNQAARQAAGVSAGGGGLSNLDLAYVAALDAAGRSLHDVRLGFSDRRAVLQEIALRVTRQLAAEQARERATLAAKAAGADARAAEAAGATAADLAHEIYRAAIAGTHLARALEARGHSPGSMGAAAPVKPAVVPQMLRAAKDRPRAAAGRRRQVGKKKPARKRRR